MSPITPNVIDAFLGTLRATGCVKTAAGSYGARRFRELRATDAAFRAAWDDALATHRGRLLRRIAAASKDRDDKRGDWKAAAWILDQRDRRVESAKRLELLNAQVALTKAKAAESATLEQLLRAASPEELRAILLKLRAERERPDE